jgi:hypothetical protein
VIKQVEDKKSDLFKRTNLQILSVKLKGAVWHNQSMDSGGTELMEKGLVNYTSEYITEEPDAVVPHVRICVGAVQVTGRSTMTKLFG